MSERGKVAVPRATYRLQFRKEFGFDDAAALAPYLAQLGISHLYASPYLKARPGSTHGYDIVDHDRLNPELGAAAAFARMVAALHDCGLSQVLDFVPNHMGVGGADNPLWLNVLEWGRDSVFAGWFDIDWEPDRRYLQDKLLVPLLGDQYGLELERGRLSLKFDAEDGTFAVWAYDVHKLPICPLHYGRILGDEHPALEQIGDSFARLPAWRPQVERRARDLKACLAALFREDTCASGAVDSALARLNGREGNFDTWKELHELIENQHWRLAHFRVAADDINYRRFFDINELAGLRMELPDVFDHVHQLIFRLIKDGTVSGLRIDHVDGLLDPKGYLNHLRDAAPRSDFYLAVEKILAHHEDLRADWPVQGTTGYEFLYQVLGFLLDPAGEAELTRFYRDFTGRTDEFAEIVRESKLRIMEHEMASELNMLSRDAGRVARENPRTADFTRNILRRALREVIAAFPVYRTYIDTLGPATEADRRDVDWAVAQARQQETGLDPSVFVFVHQLLLGDLAAGPRSGFSREAALRCAMKVQQYSGPVMAKGLEDTAVYRYNRFVALNEVGGRPDTFSLSIAAFHHANQQRAEQWPNAMLSTATHDTKRGEDTRARLAALSEFPELWAQRVETWSRLLRARRGDIEGTAPPDRNDEYLFYQLLVGTWPFELICSEPDPMVLRAYTERLKGTMLKSMREAKLHSSWSMPNQAYEEAMLSFIADALDSVRARNFLASFLPFVAHLAELGAHNTLVQTVLKLTAPGFPDIYQGTELWDLSMVDPDNRRPVDYALRKQLLSEILVELAKDRCASMRRYAKAWRDGRFKLAVIATLLAQRHKDVSIFERGSYQPIQARGEDADRICAFLRADGDKVLLVSVLRFPGKTAETGIAADSAIPVPEALEHIQCYDLISGIVHGPASALAASDLFSVCPAAVLVPANLSRGNSRER